MSAALQLTERPLSAASAAAELSARREARRSLASYATQIDIPNVPAENDNGDDDESLLPTRRYRSLVAHHQLICTSIQDTIDISRTRTRPLNLMLLFPPGSAKSTYADVVAVPWFMSSRPKGRGGVILASHSSELAKRQGRRARQVIRSKRHATIFPDATLSADRGAADNWALFNGAEYLAAGLLAGITGNRASLGILDDPMRGREAAESQTMRDKTWEAYSDDFCSRLLPGAPQIMILTRWHQDDPAGRILPEDWDGESGIIAGRDGRDWNVLCVPAVADRLDDPLHRKIGEGLWPEWFKTSHWEPFKINARTWSSLYQQKPRAAEGTFFQRSWFENARYDQQPATLRFYLSSDHASSADEGDYTVLRLWGIDAKGDLFWVDGWRGQATPDVWAIEALRLIKAYRPLCWFAENDAIWRSSSPFIQRMMMAQRAYCRIETLSTIGDKPTKAQAIQGMASMGRVHFPRTPAANEAIEEYIAFPAGRHDDEVDAGSSMGRALLDAHPAIVAPVDDKPKQKDSWARAFDGDEDADDSWRVA